ncbi:MAG: ATP-binding protein, partial [Chloroflexi bacterium]|nr:ATP-binding protein [Chloroflexota bacterium]
ASIVKRRAELEQRIGRLEAVLASLAEGVIVADDRREVVLVNPAARALLSLPVGHDQQALTVLGEPGSTLASGDDFPATERVIRSYSAPVLDDGGRPLGTVTILRDATREQELDRLKSEFLTVVSHELQTPLTAVKGALELVRDDEEGRLSRVQRRFLDTIDRNCERLVALVGDLLDLSRLEAGRVELEPRPLDAAAVIRGVVVGLSNLFDSRGIALRVVLTEDLPPILGDRRRVEQILTNLFSNAAKYTPTHGWVEVAARPADRGVAITVADSGPGVPESDRALVFDKFYRGREAAGRGEAGSGLGLAIVKSLVELHGGSVRLETGTDRLAGAHFVVELPRAESEE